MMKRFVISILSISCLFVGLGTLADQVGARFRSDEKAMEIVRRARLAIGGDAALAEVRSLVISGRSVHTLKVGDQQRQEPGETEIALQFPDKLSQKITIGKSDGPDMADAKLISKGRKMVVVNKDGEGEVRVFAGEPMTETIVVKERADGNGEFTTTDGKKIIVREVTSDGGPEAGVITAKIAEPGTPDAKGDVMFVHGASVGHRQNDLLRLSLSLLLKAPDAMEVNYTFAGEGNIDGMPVNIVNAEWAGSSYKLYFSKSSSLPVAIAYRGMPAPTITKIEKADVTVNGGGDKVVVGRKIDPSSEGVERLVKFTDYRSTGTVLLPYRWTTAVGGNTIEVFDVTSYDVNPANIAEKFAGQKVFFRTKKPDGQ